MDRIIKAKYPFRFSTRLHISVLTGLKAGNLEQLLGLIKVVPGSSIYNHTHRILQQHMRLSPEPPNDFAYWVTKFLGEDELGEKLVSIDTIKYSTIRSIREKIIRTIEDYLEKHPDFKKRFAHPEDYFHFIKSKSFVLPTKFVAKSLNEFAEILKKITIDSIYFHVFEARLRLEKGTNDFSYWIATSVGDIRLAEEINHMDPYTRTLEDLREALIEIIDTRLR